MSDQKIMQQGRLKHPVPLQPGMLLHQVDIHLMGDLGVIVRAYTTTDPEDLPELEAQLKAILLTDGISQAAAGVTTYFPPHRISHITHQVVDEGAE